nr:AIG1-like protein [Tanacetum cinerariifolium]
STSTSSSSSTPSSANSRKSKKVNASRARTDVRWEHAIEQIMKETTAAIEQLELLNFKNVESDDEIPHTLEVVLLSRYYPQGSYQLVLSLRILVEGFRFKDKKKLLFIGITIHREQPRSGSGGCQDPQGALSKLLQLGTVEEYQGEFEKLMNRVMDIPDFLFIPYYIYGLKLHLQRVLLVSKPTIFGDVFSLARIIEARFDDQAAPVAGTSAGLEANKVINDGDDSEFSGPVTPTSDSESSDEVKVLNWVQQLIDVESTYDNDARDQVSELEMKVLVDGKQDEAKVVKVVVVVVKLKIDEPGVEGNGVIGVGVNENNKVVQYSVSTLHVFILLLERLNEQYIKKKKIEAAIQKRI